MMPQRTIAISAYLCRPRRGIRRACSEQMFRRGVRELPCADCPLGNLCLISSDENEDAGRFRDGRRPLSRR